MNPDLTELSLVEASDAVTRRAVSPVELTEAYLARIEALEPALNAYVTVVADRAREDAARAEAEIARGEHRGPLHGLPVGLKDLFDTAGVRTTAGSAHRREHVPAGDSAVAARLRAAGTVLLGKHATHEYAWGGTTNNPHFGPVRNPYAPDRIPGGSSGGSAASVVARTALASVGTDTCGSVRIPAALSGCVGLKPTYGRIDLAGVVPLAPSLDHAGPITRTVADAALMFGVLVPGFDPGPVLTDLRGLRVGWLRGWFEAILDADVATGVEASVRRLAGAGCAVSELDAPDVGPVVVSAFVLVSAEAGPYHRDAFALDPDSFGPDLRANLSRDAPTPDQLAAARATLGRLTAWLDDALADVDVLVCATTPAPAPPIGAEHVDVGASRLHVESMLTRLTSIFDVAGLPALSVPCGLSAAGLPVGVQVVGRRLDEQTVLRVGSAVETPLPAPDIVAQSIARRT
ncbi:MAG TPA: amidase [Planosporangium sp.]|nr:amidase [Planosporangium sp.]